MRTHWTRLLHVDLLAPGPGGAAAPKASSPTAATHPRIDDLVTASQRLGRTVISALSDVWGAYAKRRRIRVLRAELRSLDDHLLRDLAIDRSEIDSVVAEVTGEAVPTRRRMPFTAEKAWPMEPL